jgi:hypothetical protein
VGTVFGVFVTACVVDAEGSPVDVAVDVLHAVNNMERMKVMVSIFFIEFKIILTPRS